MDNTVKQKPLTLKNKIGYGIGEFGECTGYNLFYFFFLFYLTDIVGIPASVGGIISSIAVFWDAVTDLAIGYISDNFNSKHGRRRPLMISVAIPYAVVTYLMFCSFDMSMNAKIAYAIILSIIFWTCYTVYTIPYFALGAEVTQVFEERTSLRLYAAVFLHAATMIASSTPPMIVQKSIDMGMSVQRGWSNVGLIIGLVIFIGIVICWICTRGRELPAEKTVVKKEDKVNIFRTIGQIFKLKPTVPLAVATFCGAFVCTMASNGMVYIMTNKLGFNAGRQSLLLLIIPALAIVFLPLISAFTKRFDKRTVFMFCLGFGGISLAIYYFIGITGVPSLVIWGICYQVANSSLWALYYAMMYDISEVDEFKNGKRREGIITASMAFFQKIGGSVALSVTGFVLSYGGYDGTLNAQPASAITAIDSICTVIPGIIYIIGCVALIFYPITGKRYKALLTALEAKKTGREYSTEEFEKLL
ncbi:glycoside-pentoside-hexuronide (GPH):cation symporter [Anaerovorax odorimutans]|uniref:Glycoside-pentoside-hexuronide (GPH):cation symporter n=1 Tax=Anaerovorax odorimutans TaxID=109327 RepID=A0ABT1RKT5_9FIRM|nr:glycoside-pentoside-hexuronide (GPH):cation symporter [Anaerovorax odorimutans]MCQ4635796.1 glycoside-pentoside-hexuronide (GPH):cation symporter [Anaerovorax odorimutans]